MKDIAPKGPQMDIRSYESLAQCYWQLSMKWNNRTPNAPRISTVQMINKLAGLESYAILTPQKDRRLFGRKISGLLDEVIYGEGTRLEHPATIHKLHAMNRGTQISTPNSEQEYLHG